MNTKANDKLAKPEHKLVIIHAQIALTFVRFKFCIVQLTNKTQANTTDHPNSIGIIVKVQALIVIDMKRLEIV
jgi:hypothetical protein